MECSVENCEKELYCKRLCSRHYRSLYNRGTTDSAYKALPVITKRNHLLIQTISGDSSKVDKSMSNLGDYRFYKNKGYAVTSWKNRSIFLHHLVIGFPMNGMVVDHINRDRLDNRRENLRIVNWGENIRNSNRVELRDLPIGVYRNHKNFSAYIWSNGKNLYLGTFKTVEEAVNARMNKK